MALADFNLGDIGGIFTSVREAITGEAIVDPNKQADILYKVKLLEQELLLGQIAVNKLEATHSSIFVAGARPFIMWICGFSLMYSFIVQPFLFMIMSANGVDVELPSIELGQLMALMTAMLGFGAMRSFDKTKGVGNGY